MKKQISYCLVLCFSLLLPVISSGQIKVDYLQKSFSRSKKTLTKVDSNLQKAEALFAKDPEQALKLVEQSLLRSIKTKDRKGLADAYLFLGRINFELSEYYLANINCLKAINIFKETGDQAGLYKAYREIGKTFELLGELEKSLNYYFTFLKMAQNRNVIYDVDRTKLNIAGVYLKQGKFSEAEEFYQEQYKLEKARNNKRGELNVSNSLAQLNVAQNNNDKALTYFQNSQNIAYELNDVNEVNKSFSNMSLMYRNQNDTENELKLYQKALDFNLSNDNKIAQIDNNIEIANIYIERNQNEDAIEHLEQSLKLSEETGNIEGKSNTMKALSNAYDKAGNAKLALNSFKEYLNLESEINKRKKQEILNKAERGRWLENIQNRVVLLEKDKELSDKTIELLLNDQNLQEERLRRQRVISYSLLGGLLIILLTAYLLLRSSREKRKANQLLMLKSLRSQMNPHFIFNALNSVNNFISINDERTANKYLSEFSKLMRQVMENSQKDFIPLITELEILQLYLKLEHFRFKDKFDYELKVDDSINKETYMIPPMLIQPYIENAVWHGLRYKKEKGFLKVQFIQENGIVKVYVEDNGIGRTHSQEIKTKYQKENVSTAMKNIESRLKIINDLYKIKVEVKVEDLNKEKQEGTRVVIKLTEDSLVNF